MQVTVELFGIPRARAGVAQTVADGATLGDVLEDLSRRFPDLGTACVCGRRLQPGYTVNLSGRRFVTDPDTVLQPGDAVLLLSADVGG